MEYIEIDVNNKESLKIFEKFYKEILSCSFNINELETQEQLIDTLNKKNNGFFGKNSYHIIVFFDKNNIVGGIIYDYFMKENCGLIEYIVTNPNLKRSGFASKIFEKTCILLNEESKRNGYSKLDFVCCEVEKKINGKKENHYFWEKYSFKPLDFEYLQPPLEEGKELVTFMEFGIILDAPYIKYEKNYIERELLKEILFDYSYYTMRIDNPKKEEYFNQMCKSMKSEKIYFKKC